MAGNKDNMKQAMRELLGLVGVGPEGDQDRTPVPPEDEAFQMKAKQREAEKTMEKDTLAGKQPEEKRVTHHREGVHNGSRPEITPRDTSGSTADTDLTVLSAGTSVFGDIRSEGAIEVLGKLKGNLEAAGNVRISGKVLGNVKGDCVTLVSCAVQGNITATTMLRIDQDSIVVGDLTAQDLDTNGKAKGNVQVERTAAFRKNAILSGNVSAGLVSMNEGAKIQGTVRIAEDSDTSALFGNDLDI